MIRLKKNINKKILKKKIIIFDLDGVLINSKLNMKKSWQQVQKKFDLKNISFNNYFQHIGKPFETILNELKIFENHKKIKKCYDSSSIKNLYLIKDNAIIRLD